MTQPRPDVGTQSGTVEEQLIDEMVEESFPASDATQLPGRAGGAPTGDAVTPPERDRPATPRTIGNQGTAPASRLIEETVPLADQGVVTLRFDGDHRRLHVYLGEEGMALDAKAVDRLIEVLAAKRSQMAE